MQTFGGKVTSVSLNIDFMQKCQFCVEKLKFWENVDFYIKCPLLLKVIMFLQSILIFKKMWLFVWKYIYINKLSSSGKKNFNFLGYIKLYVVIFIKVFHLLENCYFDSKYHFVHWYFGQKRHFPKIYITCGINSLDKLSNFFEKGVNLVIKFWKKWQLVLEENSVVNSEKEMTICFRS